MQLWELVQSDVAPMLVLQLLKSSAGVDSEAISPAGLALSGPSETGA